MATTTPDLTDITWDEIRAGVARLAEDRGWHHGVPMMSIFDTSREVVLAKGCPLADKHGHDVPVRIDGKPQIHICTDNDVNESQDEPRLVNVWRTKPKIIAVGRYSKGAVAGKFDDSEIRLKVYLDNLICQAGACDANAEIRAMCSLLGRLNQNQRDSYILGGAFPETSPRSGVTYILRKGRPTLAMRMIRRPEGGEVRKFLAALCFHGLGYYSGTLTGVCAPSDDVLMTLLLIRGDEADLWRKAEQHALDDPFAGI